LKTWDLLKKKICGSRFFGAFFLKFFFGSEFSINSGYFDTHISHLKRKN
jgi:hypothetical protein